MSGFITVEKFEAEMKKQEVRLRREMGIDNSEEASREFIQDLRGEDGAGVLGDEGDPFAAENKAKFDKARADAEAKCMKALDDPEFRSLRDPHKVIHIIERYGEEIPGATAEREIANLMREKLAEKGGDGGLTSI